MEIRKYFIETSNEPVRSANCVRCLGPQRYETEIEYDTHECFIQLHAKTNLILQEYKNFKAAEIVIQLRGYQCSLKREVIF